MKNGHKFEKGNKVNLTHGMRHTRFYRTWCHMVERCSNPKCERYENYGGRGIKCEWKTFEEFRDDMHESYLDSVKLFGERDTTIDRIDNDGNYCKENCRWATPAQQRRNKSNNRWIIFNSERKCLSEWAEIYKIDIQLLSQRLRRFGWTFEKATTTPVRIGRPLGTY